jgi:sugar (pentulose or hexulose) kinase
MRRMSLVGIDIGSSAVKAAAYDADGALLAQAAEAVPSLHPGPGLAGVDGDGVWKAVVAVVQQVTAGERRAARYATKVASHRRRAAELAGPREG